MDVMITDRIMAVRRVRELGGCNVGLKEAKDLTDAVIAYAQSIGQIELTQRLAESDRERDKLAQAMSGQAAEILALKERIMSLQDKVIGLQGDVIDGTRSGWR